MNEMKRNKMEFSEWVSGWVNHRMNELNELNENSTNFERILNEFWTNFERIEWIEWMPIDVLLATDGLISRRVLPFYTITRNI